MGPLFFRFCALLSLLTPAGCGDPSAPSPAALAPRLLPAENQPARIILEAETGAVEPAMIVEDFQPVNHPQLGLQTASGGKCVAVPRDANKADKKHPKGQVTLQFTVPKDGTYYIFPRVWWTGGCGNSFGMALDGGPALTVTDGDYDRWHWIKLLSDDPSATTPRPFTLKKGQHALVFTNREDASRLDQVYITDDPKDAPTGIMQ